MKIGNLGGNSIEKLQKRSEDIVSVFTKTVNELKSVNDAADKEIAAREETVAKIRVELTTLSEVKRKNTSIIKKIDQFFE